MENKRLYYLDVARGLSIIFVMLGHMIPKGNIKIAITSFHVSLFFIISGCLIKYKNENKINFIKKEKVFLLPYLFFGMCILLINGFNLWNIFLLLSGYGIGAIWYLPAIFISESLFMFFKTKIKISKIRNLIIIFLGAVPFVSTIKLENIIVDTIITVILRGLVGLVFLWIGYILSDSIVYKRVNTTLCLLIITIFIALSIINGQVDLYALIFKNKILYLLNSIILSFTVIMILKNFKESKILIYFGRNSLILMATHQSIMCIIQRLFNKQFNTYFSAILLFTLIILIEIPIIRLINRYMPWMLGKFKKKEKSEVGLA